MRSDCRRTPLSVSGYICIRLATEPRVRTGIAQVTAVNHQCRSCQETCGFFLLCPKGPEPDAGFRGVEG